MEFWQPSATQQAQYETEGYFICRNLLPRDVAMEIRGIIKNILLTPEPQGGVIADADPMDPMGDSPQARAARFRKLTNLGLQSPLIWDALYTSEAILKVVRHFLGDDALLKFNSCFLKPARTGSATPWHQDNGLWRDGETEPFNFWMALDPATRQNGCMQFIPGSHRTPIVPHVLYEDSIHGEIPREIVAEFQQKYGLHHIEMEPGDVVFWHSNLYHYSPPNTSEQGRISIAGVYSTPRIAANNPHFKQYWWTLRAGEPVKSFPAELHLAPGERQAMPPYLPAAC
jgi:ectoine hydroxylase-related dioxygenase (phytanoyl-CoA dioxygenase family)